MRLSLLCLLAGLVLAPSLAHAWEIKTTKDGLPIRWPDGEVVIDLSMGAESFDISRADGDAQVRSALAIWQRASSSHLRFAYAGAESEALPTGRDGLNVVRWGTDEDDRFVDPEALATTYLTYRPNSGEILEADIVVNAVDYQWSIGGCHERYDLQNILAHESGHLLGLGHSVERESTMYESAGRCETKKRELSDDDQQAAAYLYDNLSLSAELGGDPIASCSASGGGSGLLAAMLLLALVLKLRSRRARQQIPQMSPETIRRALARDSSLRIVRRRMLWLLLVALALHSNAAEASTARALEAQALVARADLIVEARVVHQEVRLEQGWPVTVSELQVFRCDMTHCPYRLELRQLGGEIGDIGLLVSGVRHLEEGQDFVLFLRQRHQSYEAVGKTQGIFQISTSFATPLLVRDLREVERCPSVESAEKLGAGSQRCQSPHRGGFEALSWTQFGQIFGGNLLK